MGCFELTILKSDQFRKWKLLVAPSSILKNALRISQSTMPYWPLSCPLWDHRNSRRLGSYAIHITRGLSEWRVLVATNIYLSHPQMMPGWLEILVNKTLCLPQSGSWWQWKPVKTIARESFSSQQPQLQHHYLVQLFILQQANFVKILRFTCWGCLRDSNSLASSDAFHSREDPSSFPNPAC